MKHIFLVLLAILIFSCNSSSEISHSEKKELNTEIASLNAKIDSLEVELENKESIERHLIHDSLLFSYKRTPCFGNCPVFEFRVYKDGWATFQGKNFVDMLGVYTADLSEAQLLRINNIFRDYHFYTFRNEYNDNRMDIPSMVVEYHGPQGFKKVIARTDIPRTYRLMLIELKELADEIRWTPVQ